MNMEAFGEDGELVPWETPPQSDGDFWAFEACCVSDYQFFCVVCHAVFTFVFPGDNGYFVPCDDDFGFLDCPDCGRKALFFYRSTDHFTGDLGQEGVEGVVYPTEHTQWQIKEIVDGKGGSEYDLAFLLRP